MSGGRKKRQIQPLLNNLKESNIVQKSIPLFSLWQSGLTLFEFKILDTYLSRIDSHKPEQRNVRFEKGELERLLGVKQLKPNDLKERLRHLMSNVVELKDNRKEDGFTLISLFSIAYCKKDKNGLWQIDLACTQEAMEYFFNIEELGYLRYKIRSILRISSLYSYVLFTYLEYNRFRKSWEVSLDELRSILNSTEETYKEYKRFNDLILKKTYKELTQKTDIRYAYEPIRKGRRVVAIKFTLETLSDLIISNNVMPEIEQMSFDNDTENKYSNEHISFLAEACHEEFSEQEMEVLFSLVTKKRLPEHEYGVPTAQYHYLMEKYAELNLQASRKEIKNRYAYLKKMIQEDQ